MCFFFIFSYHISVSPLEFNEVIEDKDLNRVNEDIKAISIGLFEKDKLLCIDLRMH